MLSKLVQTKSDKTKFINHSYTHFALRWRSFDRNKSQCAFLLITSWSSFFSGNSVWWTII